ncbi:MAG: hypothetical protein QNJ68_13120 [Microcoleaceae cyanobacterium MO_207.B10]|nr:hypothetical protein [Microcoleaceae cyanobacterium MO_207.B10]
MPKPPNKQLFTEISSEESTKINGGYNEISQYRRTFLGLHICPRSYYSYNRSSSDYQRYNSDYYKGNLRGYY